MTLFNSFIALQSLDSLSEEILPFLFNTSSPGNNFKKSDFDNPLLKSINLSTLQQDTVCASLTLMHNLLMDAQVQALVLLIFQELTPSIPVG